MTLTVAAVLLLLGPSAIVTADPASEVAALEAQCEKDSEAKIKPLRDMEIANCKADQNNDPAYCQRHSGF